MSGFYSQAIKSLPKYRRNIDQSMDYDKGYVQSNTSSIPCSPRLVQRNGHQKPVVTRMLRSYPQADGSFVCAVPQPTRYNDKPPPLPSKARDRQPSKTQHVMFKRNHSAPTIPNGPQSQQLSYQSQNQRQLLYESVNHQEQLAYQSKDENTNRSTQQHAVIVSNDLCNRPSYTRMHTYPNNTHLTSSTLVISTEREQPSHTIASHHHTSNNILNSQEFTEQGTPFYRAKATYLSEPRIARSNSQLSNISETSSSTYTGSMDPSAMNNRSDTQEWQGVQFNSRESSLDPEEDQQKPELYPEHR